MHLNTGVGVFASRTGSRRVWFYGSNTGPPDVQCFGAMHRAMRARGRMEMSACRLGARDERGDGWRKHVERGVFSGQCTYAVGHASYHACARAFAGVTLRRYMRVAALCGVGWRVGVDKAHREGEACDPANAQCSWGMRRAMRARVLLRVWPYGDTCVSLHRVG